MRRDAAFLLALILAIDATALLSQNLMKIGKPGTPKWIYNAIGPISSSPAIGVDGTVYVGSDDFRFYAINPDGTRKWYVFTGLWVNSSPAIAPDGTIYVGSDDHYLYAINPDGTRKWLFAMGTAISSSPAIGSDGTLYVTSMDRALYAIDPEGKKKWQFESSGLPYSSPAIGIDQTIYIGTSDAFLYAVNPDGTKKWEFRATGEIATSPAIAADGTIYVGTSDFKLFSVNPDGTQKWVYATGSGVFSSPAIGADGTIYIGSNDDRLHAVNPDGTKKWTFTTGDNITSTPAIGNDGTIYVGSHDGRFYAIKANGTQKWVLTTGAKITSSPVIGHDCTIYFGSDDNNFYAIYCTSKGLAASPWPKFHQNEQNTGWFRTLTMVEETLFAIVARGGTFYTLLKITNPLPYNVTLTGALFDEASFSLETVLPVTLNAGKTSALSAAIHPEDSRLYASALNLNFSVQNKKFTSTGEVKAGLFLDDGSELAHTARRAIAAFDACKSKDPASIATANNYGVLFRLLGETEIAKDYFQSALSRALNARFGYTGIEMNLGVVLSDQDSSAKAAGFYNTALQDISSSESGSVLAPQLFYDKAWEAYIEENISQAATEIDKTLAHVKSGTFLKAKASVLRGAIRFRQAQTDLARADFNQAILYDPSGPIGEIARQNLLSLGKDLAGQPDLLPSKYALLPNYPNPFNPETVIRFALPGKSFVIIRVLNLRGECVRSLAQEEMEPGWREVTWNGLSDQGERVGSGVYFLHLKSGVFEKSCKMTLVR